MCFPQGTRAKSYEKRANYNISQADNFLEIKILSSVSHMLKCYYRCYEKDADSTCSQSQGYTFTVKGTFTALNRTVGMVFLKNMSPSGGISYLWTGTSAYTSMNVTTRRKAANQFDLIILKVMAGLNCVSFAERTRKFEVLSTEIVNGYLKRCQSPAMIDTCLGNMLQQIK